MTNNLCVRIVLAWCHTGLAVTLYDLSCGLLKNNTGHPRNTEISFRINEK